MGWVKGLEPSTLGTTIRCSNQLSYTHHILFRQQEDGTPEGIRFSAEKPRRFKQSAGSFPRAVFRIPRPLIKKWQGRLDSNQRMSASKADALPLGDAPVSVGFKMPALSITRCDRQRVSGLYGVGKGTRTLDPRNHNPML